MTLIDVVNHLSYFQHRYAELCNDQPRHEIICSLCPWRARGFSHNSLANESGLVQGLSNMLGNAVKFVAPGVVPRIKVWSEQRGSMIRIWVEDNGIGIEPQYQNRLFGMFERVLPSKDFEGTGVGLAITQKVVERMGGTTGMESDGKNGSKFWIEMKAAEKTDE